MLVSSEEAQIVEIQRDLTWSDVPGEVQSVALASIGDAIPVRIIESVQTDGAVIYELFADRKPAEPDMEIRVYAGKVTLLTERWKH